MWTQEIIYRNIYVYVNTFIHAIKSDVEWAHQFEGEWGVVDRRVWRKESKRRNAVMRL